MHKVEYDYDVYLSEPCSLKVSNDEPGTLAWSDYRPVEGIKVTPGSRLTVHRFNKWQDLTEYNKISVEGFDGSNWQAFRLITYSPFRGTQVWGGWTSYVDIPPNITAIRFSFGGAYGSPVGITWWDDFRVILDDKVIYMNDFTPPPPPVPLKMVGAGAIIGGVIGGVAKKSLIAATLGAVIGGGAVYAIQSRRVVAVAASPSGLSPTALAWLRNRK